jgi:hypothetical protein
MIRITATATATAGNDSAAKKPGQAAPPGFCFAHPAPPASTKLV